MTAEKKVVMYDSPEAAKQMTVTGWVSRDGFFYGAKEDVARYAGCTHRPCQRCQQPVEKHWIFCDGCRSLNARERWEKLPLVEWNGEPLTLYDGDEYFFNEEDVYEWAFDNDVKVSELDLVICEPTYIRQVDEDYWADDMPEDGELPKAVREALDVFNAVISAHREPLSWHAGKRRVVLPDEMGVAKS